jgi:UDP-N-acetylmuramate: L-alanyl-gamma-D-glutamyl-meso-diaminopimelate ligase
MTPTKKVHFISIGGSVMHNLAIALQKKGYQVSGSDDEIFEPSKSRLEKYQLLPHKMGWDATNITDDLEAVILGMHAKADNPELLKAKQLGLPVYSFPEYVRQQSTDKQRIVVAGSHGKTTITAMIMHVLKSTKKEFDYVVGAPVAGFEVSVQLSDAPIIIIEGDEYLTSPLDRVPKFLKYDHHVVLISGVAWDHMNVYPTYEDYVRQFDILADNTPKGGTLIYCDEDNLVNIISTKERDDVRALDYAVHPYEIKNGQTYLKTDNGLVPLKVFGEHNMQNIEGALTLTRRIGVADEDFYKAISSFEGAGIRLQLLADDGSTKVYQDYAHAPSKVEATTKAVKQQFPDKSLIGVLELHTFSSMNKDFLPQYAKTLNSVDHPIVYVSQKALAQKKLPEITGEELKAAFENSDIQLFTESQSLQQHLIDTRISDSVVLLMSSGNFDGLDLKSFSNQLTTQN